MSRPVNDFLVELRQWAAERCDILALAVIGSHARGTARPDSDVDVVIIVDDPAKYWESQRNG
jgi:predicted nucleotidyltransferase